MKNRRRIIIFVLLALAAVLGLWKFQSSSGPQYKGRSVSFWVRQACRTSDEANHKELLTIGPAAIPFLREQLRVQETRGDKFWSAVRDRMPDSIENLLPDRIFPSDIRDGAVACLIQFGPQAEPAVPELITLLQSQSSSVDRAAAALGAIGPGAKPALPALHVALTNQLSIGRVEVAYAIWRIAQETNLVLNTLIDGITQTNDTGLIVNSTLALSSIGPSAAPAIPSLVRVLTSAPDPGARANAALALGELKAADAVSRAALQQGLADPDPMVQVNCAVTLWQIDRRQASVALPLMAARLSQWNLQYHERRLNLSEWADQRHLDLKDAEPELKALLQNSDPNIRQLAQEALDKLNSGITDLKRAP